jgi:hypothetical protein
VAQAQVEAQLLESQRDAAAGLRVARNHEYDRLNVHAWLPSWCKYTLIVFSFFPIHHLTAGFLSDKLLYDTK